MDNVDCDGTEASLAECRHGMWGQTDCNHYEDVRIRCNKSGSKRACKYEVIKFVVAVIFQCVNKEYLSCISRRDKLLANSKKIAQPHVYQEAFQ